MVDKNRKGFGYSALSTKISEKWCFFLRLLYSYRSLSLRRHKLLCCQYCRKWNTEFCVNGCCIFSCEKCRTWKNAHISFPIHVICCVTQCNVKTILWKYNYNFYWGTKLFYVLIKIYREAIFWPRLLPYMVVAQGCSRV